MKPAGDDLKALYEKACTTEDSGHFNDALALYDEVLRRGAEEPEHPGIVGDALLGKADCLRVLKRFDEAVAACDDFEQRSSDPTDTLRRRKLAEAHFHKIKSLIGLNRTADALAVCEKALVALGDASEPDLREPTARLLFEKGDLLYEMHRPAEALAIFEQLLVYLRSETGDPFLEWIARALNAKGAALDALDRREEAIDAYDAMLAREGVGHLLMADTMMSKAKSLVVLQRRDEAVAAFDRLIEYCRENARYMMGDDYRKWALHQVGGEAMTQRGLLLE